MGPKSTNKGIQFTRHVPDFLRDYEHLLTTNKKNYLNENVEKFDGKFCEQYEDILDGATIYEPNVDLINSRSEVFPTVKEPNKNCLVSSIPDRANEEPVPPAVVDKVVFNRDVCEQVAMKRKVIEVIAKSKIPRTITKNSSRSCILSFNVEE